jgi:hypothetical protein|tara:strand:- start:3278 stop:3391 length:114 start_codon:yes stop_codon:yes gene_type:complete
MKRDSSLEKGELDEEDKFKKIKFSPDTTDVMSDFSDK